MFKVSEGQFVYGIISEQKQLRGSVSDRLCIHSHQQASEIHVFQVTRCWMKSVSVGSDGEERIKWLKSNEICCAAGVLDFYG